MNSADRARELLGVPFIHLGRNTHGIDCVGLVAHAQSLDMDTIPTYPRDPYNQELEKNLDRVFGAPVLVYDDHGADGADLRAGDILAMAYFKHIRHVGLAAAHPFSKGELSVIHTDAMVGKVVEHMLDAKWLRRIRRVYRP